MSSGNLPLYSYIPPARPNIEPVLRSCSSRRARLFAGGTYFRSRDPGKSANLISVSIIEVEPTTGPGTGEAYCVITNSNIDFKENISGEVQTKFLDLKGTYQDLWEIRDITTEPRTHYYSISLRIAFQRQTSSPALPTSTDLGPFTFGKAFIVPGKMSVQLEKSDVQAAPGASVFITPRSRLYALSGILIPESPENPGSGPTHAWDISALRAEVNAHDPWVEMLQRSGPSDDGAGGSIPNPNPFDVQDEGSDAAGLTPFPMTNLSGGDGLPSNPNLENTGPTRSLVHVDTGEKQNGEMGDLNVVFEWVGDSNTSGTWKAY